MVPSFPQSCIPFSHLKSLPCVSFPFRFSTVLEDGLNPTQMMESKPHQHHAAIPICSSSLSQPDLILPADNMETIVLGGLGGSCYDQCVKD